MICTLRQILFGLLNAERNGQGMQHVCWSKKHSHDSLVERREVKGQLGRPSSRWENNTGCIKVIGAVLKLIIFTSMVNRIINSSRNERVTQHVLNRGTVQATSVACTVPRFNPL